MRKYSKVLSFSFNINLIKNKQIYALTQYGNRTTNGLQSQAWIVLSSAGPHGSLSGQKLEQPEHPLVDMFNLESTSSTIFHPGPKDAT